MTSKNCSSWHSQILFLFFFFSETIRLDISCELSSHEMLSYFLWKKKKIQKVICYSCKWLNVIRFNQIPFPSKECYVKKEYLTLSLPQAIIIGFCKQHRSKWDAHWAVSSGSTLFDIQSFNFTYNSLSKRQFVSLKFGTDGANHGAEFFYNHKHFRALVCTIWSVSSSFT